MYGPHHFLSQLLPLVLSCTVGVVVVEPLNIATQLMDSAS